MPPVVTTRVMPLSMGFHSLPGAAPSMVDPYYPPTPGMDGFSRHGLVHSDPMTDLSSQLTQTPLEPHLHLPSLHILGAQPLLL